MMDLSFTFGGSAAWEMHPASTKPIDVLTTFARTRRPADAQGLGAVRDKLLVSDAVEFGPGASARWNRDDGSLFVTPGWGEGSPLVVSAARPEGAIELARHHLAEGIRAALLTSDQARIGDYLKTDLAAAGSYVLHVREQLLVTSDSGALSTKTIPGAAELLRVLMGRTGQPVGLGELRTRAEDLLRALAEHAAAKGFPLPIAAGHHAAQFIDLPAPCSLPRRRLIDPELQGCGLGALAGRYRVSVGDNRVTVYRPEGPWRRNGTLVPPMTDDDAWRLKVSGSNMRSTVVILLKVDPCGGPGGLRTVVGRVIDDYSRRRAT